MSEWIEKCKQIVKEHQHQEIDGQIVDPTTASLLIKVYDSLGVVNKEKFKSCSINKAVSIAWRLVK